MDSISYIQKLLIGRFLKIVKKSERCQMFTEIIIKRQKKRFRETRILKFYLRDSSAVQTRENFLMMFSCTKNMLVSPIPDHIFSSYHDFLNIKSSFFSSFIGALQIIVLNKRAKFVQAKFS